MMLIRDLVAATYLLVWTYATSSNLQKMGQKYEAVEHGRPTSKTPKYLWAWFWE